MSGPVHQTPNPVVQLNTIPPRALHRPDQQAQMGSTGDPTMVPNRIGAEDLYVHYRPNQARCSRMHNQLWFVLFGFVCFVLFVGCVGLIYFRVWTSLLGSD